MSWCYSAVSLGLLCHFRIFNIGTLPSPCYWLWSFCPQRNTMSHIRVHLAPKLATALRSAKYQILILIPQLLLCLLTLNWFYLNHVVVRVEGLGTQSEAWVTDRASPSCDPRGYILWAEDVCISAPDIYTKTGPMDTSQRPFWSLEGEAQTAGSSNTGTVPAPKALTLFDRFCLK